MNRPIFEMRFTAAPEHIDELGHVNNAVWVKWMEQLAVAHWEAAAAPEHKDAYFWVVVRHEIDYLRAAVEGDGISARTWVGDAPRGAVRAKCRVFYLRRENLRQGEDRLGDYRQGDGAADPRSSGSDSAVHFGSISTGG